MGNVIEFPGRTPQGDEAEPDFSAEAASQLATMRRMSGGNSSRDGGLVMRIDELMKQFIATPSLPVEIKLPAGLQPEVIAQIEASFGAALNAQLYRERIWAGGVLTYAMLAAALEVTGAEMPPELTLPNQLPS